jgi:small GTP-binding protein
MFSFVKRFMKYILSYFGFNQKKAKILLLGLENLGKTTLMNYLINEGEPHKYQVTENYKTPELKNGNITFSIYDLGDESARRDWKENYQNVDGIIFLVDSAYRIIFLEVKEELEHIVNSVEKQSTPIAIVASKIELMNSA